MNRKGFTLVELSIVLVIIGLLIGGILVGQSLIESAKLNRVVSKITQFGAAVSTFKSKYKTLPADYGRFSKNNNTTYGDGIFTNDEGNYFWPELSLGVGLKNSLGTNYIPNIISVNPPTAEQAPTFDIDQYSTSTDRASLIAQDLNGKVWFVYASLSASGYGAWAAQNYDPLGALTALAIDNKIDNGTFTGGNIIFSTLGNNSTNTCFAHLVTGTNYPCSMRMHFAAFAGIY